MAVFVVVVWGGVVVVVWIVVVTLRWIFNIVEDRISN